LWQPGACNECRKHGYNGRVAIFEFLKFDDDFRPLIQAGDAAGIKRLAREKGARLLHEDGIRRAFAGDTSLAEVFRVAMEN
ncbi:MAG: type II secretion system protein GspE, partial [Verrucomicrobia bacterium]